MTPPPTTPTLEQERRARALLSLISEPGDWAFLSLAHELGGCGLVRALQEDSERHELLLAAAARLGSVDLGRELENADRLGVRFVIPGDAEWPAQVDDLHGVEPLQDRSGVPIGLWVKGPLRLDHLKRSVAIVGSRSSTTYGDTVASDIAAGLGYAGLATVSGAAFGIDYAAHRGALSARAATIAVLACGPDRIYPQGHRQLLDHLGRHHAVVSEAPPGSAPHRIRFLARNRLIAALTTGTVVVEAAARSGALNTLNWAQRLNRVTMAVPGPVTSASSVGVHEQIRSGAATLVTSGPDVLELVGAAGEHLTEVPRGPATSRDQLPVKDRQVLDAVPVAQSAGTDSIAVVAGLGLIEVRKTLERLATKGMVAQDLGGWHLTEEAMR